MDDASLIDQINDDLDAAIATRLADAGPRSDCIGDCAAAYDRCMGSAGSDLEKAACKAKYNKCIADC